MIPLPAIALTLGLAAGADEAPAPPKEYFEAMLSVEGMT